MSRFFNTGSRVLRLVTAIVAVGSAHAVFLDRGEATTLTLDTGKSVSLSPGGFGSFTFTVTNDAGALTEDFLGWVIGVQILPVGGTIGSLTIGGLSQPGTNPLPAGAVELTQPTLSLLANSATINGSDQYYLTSSVATIGGFVNTVDSNASYNLGVLSVTASVDALGTWNVYAVQQGGSFYKTYWTDGGLTDLDFGNFPRGANGSNTSLLLGSLSVVPEPSGLALAGTALAGVAWAARRIRRKQRAAAA